MASSRPIQRLLHYALRLPYAKRLHLSGLKFFADWYVKRSGFPILAGGGAVIAIDNPGEYIQRRILTDGVYEPEIARALSVVLRPGDVFFDVGANIGLHSIIAASCGAEVHAFEPAPHLLKKIEHNVRLNRLEGGIRIVPLAASNRAGAATLYLAERQDDGSHSLLQGVPGQTITGVPITTTTLDSYVAETSVAPPALVKIDVEGAEALALDGAQNLLASPQPPIFIIETADRLADSIGESAASVLGRLSRHGYRIFILRAGASGVLQEIPPEGALHSVTNYLAIHANSARRLPAEALL